ncbi:MAG TPA: MogA/MoaB family molybdenum cofactor biosynthesis protein [Gemmatimonadaceae bacterium]|nr:MogA/MoaB family molybdenum cofactor biosynthesis protein [Gemmatimonadaceae bacterium]
MRIAILTISDAGARGERASDDSGDAIAAWVTHRGDAGVAGGSSAGSDIIVGRALVSDDVTAIAAQLIAWCDGDVADLVLTTGGTGLAPRDTTPEATRAVLEREALGIAERIRVLSVTSFPRAALSRGLAGVRARTLIINLPGSTSGVRDGLSAIDPIIEHAVRITRGVDTHHEGEGTK